MTFTRRRLIGFKRAGGQPALAEFFQQTGALHTYWKILSPVDVQRITPRQCDPYGFVGQQRKQRDKSRLGVAHQDGLADWVFGQKASDLDVIPRLRPAFTAPIRLNCGGFRNRHTLHARFEEIDQQIEEGTAPYTAILDGSSNLPGRKIPDRCRGLLCADILIRIGLIDQPGLKQFVSQRQYDGANE